MLDFIVFFIIYKIIYTQDTRHEYPLALKIWRAFHLKYPNFSYVQYPPSVKPDELCLQNIKFNTVNCLMKVRDYPQGDRVYFSIVLGC
jgi:hypothetical protein